MKEIYANPKNNYTKRLLKAIPIMHPSQRKRDYQRTPDKTFLQVNIKENHTYKSMVFF
ncbi:MAG: ABC-type oligopeptide transport system ATPase subunit [Psychromonas sp.]